ncbi:hypothetical protein FD31_GL000979 [Companilactobacillus nantensis DSM 16982]|uniref:DUF4352 domain-containing protein n=1 Tax=Companilactobacillus nantensis DSM 16982 TaxID=1423774 RepID=A0A0R1WL74_9LACO|nr:hypothetical protein FD31_GL000979 [Companilactobacillus nantensis DSM 16982]
MIKQANKGIKVLDTEDKKLQSNKSNKGLTKDLVSFNKKCRRTLNGIKSGNGKDYFSATAKKIADEYFEGSDTKSIKDYNKWNKKQSSTDDTESDSTDTDDSDSSSDTTSSDEAKVDKIKRHDVTWSDNSWAGVKVSIDYANVGTFKNAVEDSDGNTFQGAIVVNFKVETPERDISIYPNQATLTTNDGQQIDASLMDSDDIGGDLMKGANKEGNVVFYVPTLSSPSDITSIRLKFSGSYDTDDYSDDNAYHDFDTGVINLN